MSDCSSGKKKMLQRGPYRARDREKAHVWHDESQGSGAGALRVQKKFFAKIVSRGKVNNGWLRQQAGAKAMSHNKGTITLRR